MSRSGYGDGDGENWAMIQWRGRVTSAMRGRRGQAFLREMLAALDALPERRLISGDLVREGEVCAIGAVALSRGVSTDDIDPEDHEAVAARFGIAHAMACEIMYENDEYGETRYVEAYGPPEYPWHRRPHVTVKVTPEERFERVRAWVVENIKKED